MVDELAPQFEAASKHKVAITYDLAANLKRQIESGAPFDVTILTPAMLDDLIKQGKVAADTRNVIARTGLAVMIKSGARKADISTRRRVHSVLLLDARVDYLRQGRRKRCRLRGHHRPIGDRRRAETEDKARCYRRRH